MVIFKKKKYLMSNMLLEGLNYKIQATKVHHFLTELTSHHQLGQRVKHLPLYTNVVCIVCEV